jgi:hypothetical protein
MAANGLFDALLNPAGIARKVWKKERCSEDGPFSSASNSNCTPG